MRPKRCPYTEKKFTSACREKWRTRTSDMHMRHGSGDGGALENGAVAKMWGARDPALGATPDQSTARRPRQIVSAWVTPYFGARHRSRKARPPQRRMRNPRNARVHPHARRRRQTK